MGIHTLYTAFDGYNIDYPHSRVVGPADGPLITENYNYLTDYIYYHIWKSDRVRYCVGEPW